MIKKLMLLAVTAVAVLAFAAMPAIASAAPTIDFSKATPIPFTGTSGISIPRNSGFAQEIECTSDTSKGEWTSSATGTLEITFKGCKNVATGLVCTSAGKASGEITAETLAFHLAYIKGFTKTVGILLTIPVSGKFTEYSCGSLFKVAFAGNGLIMHLTNPHCGETSGKATFSATATGAVQTYQEVEGNTTKYHLTSSLNGGTYSEASWETTEETELSGGVTETLTCL
ncbi:MAG: hypothetical protein ACTHN3_10095 [Solirubrobacterales bacterium]